MPVGEPAQRLMNQSVYVHVPHSKDRPAEPPPGPWAPTHLQGLQTAVVQIGLDPFPRQQHEQEPQDEDDDGYEKEAEVDQGVSAHVQKCTRFLPVFNAGRRVLF